MATFATVAVVLPFVLWQGFQYSLWRRSLDYSTRPAADLFRQILGQPVPPGATKLLVAGRRSPLGKNWVWMSFTATEPAMRALTGEDKPIRQDDAAKVIALQSGAYHRFEAEDKERVGWAAVRGIRRPEVHLVGRSLSQ